MDIGKINFRTYCHATEDPSKVMLALGFLLDDDEIETKFEKKLKNYKISRTKGHFGNPIDTYEVDLTKSLNIKEFWNNLHSRAPALIDQLITEVPERTDEDCYFHIRFDKQKAFQKLLEFTVHGDCIVAKIKIKAYPAKRDLALKKIEHFLKNIS
jgi:RNA binding exosome subunit